MSAQAVDNFYTDKLKTARIDFLCNAWRYAKTDAERNAACIEMNTLVPSRKWWSSRNGRSYQYAKKKGLIESRNAGYHRGVKVEENKIPASRMAELSKARDELHKFCKKKYIGMADEIAMGEILTMRGRKGEDIKAVLKHILGEAA